MQQATAFLAYSLFLDPNAIIPIIPGVWPEKGPVKRNKLGDLEQEFFSPADQGSKVDPGAPIVLQRFPWLVDLLSCWLSGTYGASKLLVRVRS